MIAVICIQASLSAGVPAVVGQGRPGGPARAAPAGLHPLPEARCGRSMIATPRVGWSSRLTSDIDAIAELLVGGFDGLVTAVLTMLGVGILLLTLDLKLGAVCLICFPIVMALVRWFSRNSGSTYRRVREASALVIVHFVETMTGIKAVQAYRREAAEPGDLHLAVGPLPRRQRRLVPAGGDLHAGRSVDRQPDDRARAAVRRLPGHRGRHDRRRAGRVPALPADVLRADAGDQPVLQHVPVGVGRAGEVVRGARGGADVRPRRQPSRCRPPAASRCSTTSTSPTRRTGS